MGPIGGNFCWAFLLIPQFHPTHPVPQGSPDPIEPSPGLAHVERSTWGAGAIQAFPAAMIRHLRRHRWIVGAEDH